MSNVSDVSNDSNTENKYYCELCELKHGTTGWHNRHMEKGTNVEKKKDAKHRVGMSLQSNVCE